MRQVLVTTTIRVPEVLREYRKLDSEVIFVIAGDKGGPHRQIDRLCDELGNCIYLLPEEQEYAYPELSEAIGWNNIQRRNIAILEAVELEPDVIVSVDDDNWPTDDYFAEIEAAFSHSHYGYLAKGEWFNIGSLAEQEFTYRGFPYRYVEPHADYGKNGTAHSIGILNGLIFGDPDVNAVERRDLDPQVFTYGVAAQAGVSVDPSTTWTPLNAQNTAYRAELAPLMLQLPRVGRYDDIFGSLIAQRVLANTGLHVRFGHPFVRQDRNHHDLEKDIADEEFGATWSLALAQSLRSMQVEPGTVLERLRAVLSGLQGSGVELPHEFFERWLEAWD